MVKMTLKNLRFKRLRKQDKVDAIGASPTNEQRAKNAEKFVLTYAVEHEGEYEEVETIVTDLLADLAHFCRLTELSFENCVRRATEHHRAETRLEP
jgi:hypothetical protein